MQAQRGCDVFYSLPSTPYLYSLLTALGNTSAHARRPGVVGAREGCAASYAGWL